MTGAIDGAHRIVRRGRRLGPLLVLMITLSAPARASASASPEASCGALVAQIAHTDVWNLGRIFRVLTASGWEMSTWVTVVQGTIGETTCGG